MAMATDEQMQTYSDVRLRPRAEEGRHFVNALRDDLAVSDDVMDRAANGPMWDDGRTDGPPVLMDSGHFLKYRTVMTLMLLVIDGTATQRDVMDLSAAWVALQDACVRPT